MWYERLTCREPCGQPTSKSATRGGEARLPVQNGLRFVINGLAGSQNLRRSSGVGRLVNAGWEETWIIRDGTVLTATVESGNGMAEEHTIDLLSQLIWELEEIHGRFVRCTHYAPRISEEA